MGVATAYAVALGGAIGHLIEVQVDVSAGVVGTTMVGRLDAAVQESQTRVRMAITNNAPDWPATKRVTILLAPADLPKAGTHFDLAIAVAVKAADGGVPPQALPGTVFIGELTLTGGLRSVPGVLPMVLAASARGISRVFVPETQVGEASMVPGMEVIGVRSLAQVIAVLLGEEIPEAPPVAEMSGARLLAWRGQDQRDHLDLADLEGAEDAKLALEVAAAGGHHLLFVGPKGSGKTTLAERLPTIMPDLLGEEALELSALHSLAGALEPGDGLIMRPPFCAPHHDASKASLVGGGTGRVRPGELSRAHCGVLFLDEFPLFRSDVVQALREPLEGGEITVARGQESTTFPARGIVILAANPCPCGEYAPGVAGRGCSCREVQRRDYRLKLEGPIADRIDIRREVRPPRPGLGRDPLAVSESSAQVRERVSAARARQMARYAGCGWRLNAHALGHVLRQRWPLPDEGRQMVEDLVYAGRLTHRGAVRVHRLSMTLADLAGRVLPAVSDVDVALRLRLGESLAAHQLRHHLKQAG